MARRKQRRLGSSSETHSKNEDSNLRAAYENTINAEYSFSDGRCRAAGKYIDRAWFNLGSAAAHTASGARSDPDAKRYRSIRDRLKAVDSKFEATCVRKSPQK